MQITVRPDGPIPARIMIVGEAPGEWEERQGIPFVGPSGSELNRMLHEAGISRSECFVTNVCRVRPEKNDISRFICSTKAGKPVRAKKSKLINPAIHKPLRDLWVTEEILSGYELLCKEIEMVKPEVIVTVGNLSMWALTGNWGITKWRGSMLQYVPSVEPSLIEIKRDANGKQYTEIGPLPRAPRIVKLLPTYHPAAVLRQWSWRAITVNDLRRAARASQRFGFPWPKPQWDFTIRPTFDRVVDILSWLHYRLLCGERFRLSFDLETRQGHIACAGLSWSFEGRMGRALCIPFMCTERADGYWSAGQEATIVWMLYRLLTHKLLDVVGQNIIYDCQYTWRHWCFVPHVVQDTMIAQHAIFSDMPKALAFLASMYCEYYVYWKDEGKTWDDKTGEDQLWYYNCEDCVYTDEVGQALEKSAISLGLSHVQQAQQRMFWPVLQAMQRGVRVDKKRRDEMVMEVHEAVSVRQEMIRRLAGFALNPDSPKQMHTFFYQDLSLPIQWKRGKKGEPSRPTLDDDALGKLARLEPLIKPLINCIADIRTLGKFLSNFLCRPLDIDGRMRCAYNIGGSESGKSAPKTFRLSSSENAFGSGTNLQNIPSEKSKSMGKAAARGGIAGIGDPYQFPNIREIFIPDPGYTWFDMDLERADLFVVCWEADDEQLKTIMRMGADIHLVNAFVVSGKEPPPIEECVETHPKYPDHRRPMKMLREFAKVFCHGTNYLGQAKTMAAHTGRTIHEIDRAQRIWFGAHPGIRTWHDRVKYQSTKYHFIENKFGYRWYLFDRLENILAECVAWIPQSTVSIVINRIWERIYSELPEVQILMQVHDSLPGQLPTQRCQTLLPKLRELSRIVIPYDDPLVIPVSIKTSEKSWGDC